MQTKNDREWCSLLCKYYKNLLISMEKNLYKKSLHAYGDLDRIMYAFNCLHKLCWNKLDTMEMICEFYPNINPPLSDSQNSIDWNKLNTEFANILINPHNDWNISELNNNFPIFDWELIIQNLRDGHIYPAITTQFDFMKNILTNNLNGIPLNYFEISKRNEITTLIVKQNPTFLWNVKGLILNKSININFIVHTFIVKLYKFRFCPEQIYSRTDLTIHILDFLFKNNVLLNFNKLISNQLIISKNKFFRTRNIYQLLYVKNKIIKTIDINSNHMNSNHINQQKKSNIIILLGIGEMIREIADYL